jgi:hypothetical protein
MVGAVMAPMPQWVAISARQPYLAAGQRPQPLVDRVQLGVQVVDLAQRHLQRLPASRRQRHLLQPAAGGP